MNLESTPDIKIVQAVFFESESYVIRKPPKSIESKQKGLPSHNLYT